MTLAMYKWACKHAWAISRKDCFRNSKLWSALRLFQWHSIENLSHSRPEYCVWARFLSGPFHGHALGFNCAAGNRLRNVKNSNLFQPLHYTTLVGCRHEHCKLYMLQCGSVGPLPVSLLMQAGTLLFANHRNPGASTQSSCRKTE